MKLKFIIVFFILTICCVSQDLEEISSLLGEVNQTIAIDTTKITKEMLLKTYNIEKYYNGIYIKGDWDISTIYPLFDYLDIRWDKDLNLEKITLEYKDLIDDLKNLNKTLKIRTKYSKKMPRKNIVRNFFISFEELVNVSEINKILDKYQNKSLYYSFNFPLNKLQIIPNDRSLDPSSINYTDIHFNITGNFYTNAFHKRGWAWEHYSVKTPLSWEFSSGINDIVIVNIDLPDNAPYIQVPIINKSRYPDIVEKISSSGEGNWNIYSSTFNNLGDSYSTFTSRGLIGPHPISVLPKAIGKGNNDNLLSSPNNPLGGFIGSCYNCNGVLLFDHLDNLKFEELDTDFHADGNFQRVRVACRPITNDFAKKVQFERGTIWVSGIGNNLTPPCDDLYKTFGFRVHSNDTIYYNTRKRGSTQTVFAGNTAEEDFKGLTVAGLADGIMYNTNCEYWFDPNTNKDHPAYMGRERFQAGWLFSPGIEKFNSNANQEIRTSAKALAAVDVLGPSVSITDMTVNEDMVISLNGNGVSQGQPFIAGVAGLMTSINDYMGVPLDANGHPIVGEDVQRKFYDIVTFTADKIIDDGDTPEPFLCEGKWIVTEAPIQPEYVLQVNDKLKRWWAQRCGFGKVNAYRSMAHAIENKTDYIIDGNYTFPFADDNGNGDSRGYITPDGNQILHMGSWADDDMAPEFYEVGVDRGPTSGDDDPWQVLDWGGASNPMHPEAYNNYGVTILKDLNKQIELVVGASGTSGNRKNQILAIDGNLIGIPSWANHKIRTDKDNDEGLILIEGYLKDVEIIGELRVGDLDIDGTPGGVSCLWLGEAPTESEIYGVVTLYNDGMLFGGGGLTTLQPGAHIRVAGDKDIALRFDSEWHMRGGSKISAVDISYDALNYDIETPNNRKFFIEGGSKLYIDEAHKVELDIEVEVLPCGELIVEKDALLRIKKLKVHKGGILTVDEGAKITFDSPQNELFGTNAFTGTASNPIILRAETFRDCKYDNDNVIGNTVIDVCYSFPYSSPEVITQNVTFNNLNCYFPCPTNSDWFVLRKAKPGDCPNSTDCEITHSLNIPSEYICSDVFSHYRIETILNGQSNSTSVLPYNGENELPSINICIGENDIYIVKIYLYRSISDPIPCMVEQTVTCDCDCPDEADNWVILTSEKGASPCAVNQCYVSHDLNVNSDSYPCYTHVEVSSELDGESIIIPTVLTLNNIDLSTYNLCIAEGESYTLNIKLMRGPADPDPCIVEKTVFCELESSLPPCKPDCFDDDFVDMPPIYFELSSCPGCWVKVNYSMRFACNLWQDIQITSIERFEVPASNWNSCGLCSNAEVYQSALFVIINRNQMHFGPLDFGNCSSVWRVSKASCWANWERLIVNPITFELKTIELNKPCNPHCCLRLMRVCLEEDGSKSVTDLGTGGLDPAICNDLTYQTTYPPIENIDCEFTCDMLDEIDEVVLKSGILDDGIGKDYFKINSTDLIFEYNLSQSIDRLDINIAKTNVNSLSIMLLDINGKVVNQINTHKVPSPALIPIDISALVSGTYFIGFTLDGIEIKTDKFIVVK